MSSAIPAHHSTGSKEPTQRPATTGTLRTRSLANRPFVPNSLPHDPGSHPAGVGQFCF